MDKIRDWWYESNANKSKGGLIFMIVAFAIFAGVLGYIFL